MNPMELLEGIKSYDPRIKTVNLVGHFNPTGYRYVEVTFHTTHKVWCFTLDPYIVQAPVYAVFKQIIRSLDKILSSVPPIVQPKLPNYNFMTPYDNDEQYKDVYIGDPSMGKFNTQIFLTEKELEFLKKTKAEFESFESAKNVYNGLKNGKCSCPSCMTGTTSTGAMGDVVRTAILTNCPGASSVIPKCPLCAESGPATLLNMVIHLNDRHDDQWTRNDIADWLESLDVNIEFARKEKTND